MIEVRKVASSLEEYRLPMDFSVEDFVEKAKEISPQSCFPYLGDRHFRLSESWRSIAVPIHEGWHFVLKGTEVLSPDLDLAYEKYFKRPFCLGLPSNGEHFWHREGKIPLVTTAEECEREFQITTNINLDLMRTHGHNFGLPIPLFWGTVGGAWKKGPAGRRFLTQLATDFLIEEGSVQPGIYAYLVPEHPLRLEQWQKRLEQKGAGFQDWKASQSKDFDGLASARKLISAFVGLASVGWILTPIGKEYLGNPLKLQNITTGGTLLDLGDVKKISNSGELTDYEQASFLNSISALIEAVSHFLVPTGRVESRLRFLLAAVPAMREVAGSWSQLDEKGRLFGAFSTLLSESPEQLQDALEVLLRQDLNLEIPTVV